MEDALDKFFEKEYNKDNEKVLMGKLWELILTFLRTVRRVRIGVEVGKPIISARRWKFKTITQKANVWLRLARAGVGRIERRVWPATASKNGKFWDKLDFLDGKECEKVMKQRWMIN